MPAYMNTVKVTKYEVRCDDCNISMGSVMRQTRYITQLIKQHDKYCHGDLPIPHKMAHHDFRGILGGWNIECVCGNRDVVHDSAQFEGWRCRLDKS